MAHDHDHHDHSRDHAGHGHAPDNFGRAFAIGATLNTAFVIAELIFGYAANSLALISDAVHNLSDVIALLLAWGAAWLAQKQPQRVAASPCARSRWPRVRSAEVESPRP